MALAIPKIALLRVLFVKSPKAVRDKTIQESPCVNVDASLICPKPKSPNSNRSPWRKSKQRHFFVSTAVAASPSEMKQTVVIKVSMDGRKARYKALKIAIGLSGVVSASFIEVTDQIEVKGDRIDAVKLIELLRKIVGPADLISVAEDMKKKEDGKKKNKPTLLQHDVTSYSYSYSYPAYSLYETGSASQPLDLFQGCSCC